jgi:hypothetical protein
MDIKNRILEALQVQPLSEEEKASRHILGRLYGPIATCVESTRNGRLYNRPLWEKALADEIFLEKVATKALFLELGHPEDREETDMKQACACIPEVPKIVDNDLYAYIDILDTPNGRLLKTLVDYGFVPGISSRGSGDVMENDEVDPETFFLETWDIVQLPAVRKARLNICESLDSENIKLKKALAESYKAAGEEEKDTMKKALENLNIDIDKELAEEPNKDSEQLKEASKKILTADDIPWDPEIENSLTEDTEDEDVEDFEEVESTEETTEETEDADGIEEVEDPSEEAEEAEETAEEDEAATDLNTVADAIEMLQEHDPETKIEFEPVVIDGEEYPIENLDSFVNDDDTLVIGVDCGEPETTDEEASEETADDIDSQSEEDNSEDEEIISDDAENADSAEDNGDDEVIESLKEMIRQKEALENENKDLRKAKAVGDAKVDELQESLNRYKKAFAKASAVASKVNTYKTQITELNEQLAQSKDTIDTLTEQVNNGTQQLKESVDKNANKVKTLTEEVNTLNKKSEALEAKLQSQNTQYTKKLQERTEIAKSYKARFIETLTKYVESKASMLGIQPSEITSRLNENYSLADVDAVCEQILDSTVNYGRLPFGRMNKASARITESVSTKRTALDAGYEVDDSLLELAGLKDKF